MRFLLSAGLFIAKHFLTARAGGAFAGLLEPLTKHLSDHSRHKHLEMIETLKTTREVRLAELQAKRESKLAAINASREIRLATAGFPEMRLLTFLIALPFVIHLNLVAADTNFKLGWGIPAFPSPFDEWEGAILLSFFGVQGASVAFRAAAYAITKRR